jgi:YHS domain-containing protein
VAEQAQPAEPDRAAESADLAQLTRITDPSQVCMVRNHFMGRPQLSVALQGGTYFGCCAGCANRLLADPGARVAIDPVNHHTVDKALAVLAMTPRGSVLYFENELTFSAFRAGLN